MVSSEDQPDYDNQPVQPAPEPERIEQRSTFRMIPDCVLDFDKPYVTQLYGKMLKHTRGKTRFIASFTEIAKFSGMSRRQIADVIPVMLEQGFIRIEKHHNGGMKMPSEYVLIAHLIESKTPDTSEVHDMHHVEHNVHSDDAQHAPTGAQSALHVKKHVNEKHVEILNPPVSPQGERAPEPAPKAPTASRQRFDQFWEAYPSKVGKLAALKAWEKVKPDAALTETIIAAVTAQKGSDRWQRGYIPNPTTWLNQGRWSDVLPVAAPTDKPRAWNDPKAGRKVF